jgi:signal transduction histidine kinase
MVDVDQKKIQQVFDNVLNNAVQHCLTDAQICIDLSLEADTIVCIRIIDNGTGINSDYFNHMFEPFFTTRKGGTGLGLGIVKRIIENHHGSILLKNNAPVPGATVEIKLPTRKN